MHIITGMVVAALLGRAGRTGAGIPRLTTGPLRTSHVLPGRVRFHAPMLAGAGRAVGEAAERLSELDGVSRVEVSAVTGSILVRYSEAELAPALLFAAVVRVLGLDAALARTPEPKLTRQLRDLGGSLNRAVYEETHGLLDLWSLVLIVLAVYGAAQVAAKGRLALPAGATFLWWSLNGLGRGRMD